jgi:hypothetical protein
MPLVASFSVASTSNPAALLLTDTSTGSDGAVTDRQILLYNTANALIGQFDWPIAQSSITITPLTEDISLNILVNWNNNVGATLYTYSQLFAALEYVLQFEYSLIQQMTAQPNIINDQEFLSNLGKLRTFIDSANQSISQGQDIQSAQVCINLYQQLMANPQLYF